jgi:hypothetical protein
MGGVFVIGLFLESKAPTLHPEFEGKIRFQ